MPDEPQPTRGDCREKQPCKSQSSKTMNRRAALLGGISAMLTAGLGVQAGFAATAARTLEQSAQQISGKWTVHVNRRGAELLVMTFPLARNSVTSSTFYLGRQNTAKISGPPLPKHGTFRPQSIRLLPGSPNTVHFSRDAGAFTLFGFDWQRRAGSAAFVPSLTFAESLHAGGISLGDRQLLVLALADATFADIKLMSAAFPDADVTTLAFLKMSHRTVKSAAALKELLPTMTARDLNEFVVVNVKPSYVLSLRQSGLRDLTPADVSDLKFGGVTADFIRSKTVNNIVPSVRELLNAKASTRS